MQTRPSFWVERSSCTNFQIWSKKVQKGSAVRKYLWPLWDSRNCILFPNCSDRLQEKNVFAIFLRSLEQLLRVKGQNNFSNTYYFNLVQFKCIGTRIYVPIWSNNLDVVSWRNKFEKNFGSEKGYPWKAFLCDFKTQCNVCGSTLLRSGSEWPFDQA